MPSFSIPWNTFSTADGPHTIYAVVRDSSGNTVTTSTVTVTVSNPVPPGEDPPPEVEEPPTPPPPVITPPAVVSTTTIPLGAVFYNTLGEFSTFVAEAVFPSSTDPDLSNFTDDWIDVVRDMGVVGDGSDETDKIQAALDQASANSIAGAGKTRVLIPSSVEVFVAPVEDDLCAGSEYGPVGVCLWVDSGVHFRVNGVLKAKYSETYNYTNDNVTILEARNSFVGLLEDGDRDVDITIDGTGTIDLEGIYSSEVFTSDETFEAGKVIKSIWAIRAYKVSKLTIRDLTIKHGVGEKTQIGFCEHVTLDNIKFDSARKYEDVTSPEDTALINLDGCRGVYINACLSKDCGIYRGVAIWASTEVVIDGNNFSDLISGDGTEDFHALGKGVWFVDYGMEFGTMDVDQLDPIYTLDEGLDAKLTITNNIFCRNGSHGIEIDGGALQGVLTSGVFILGNKLCSNGGSGIYYDGLTDYLFSSNQIESNGWGTPLRFT